MIHSEWFGYDDAPRAYAASYLDGVARIGYNLYGRGRCKVANCGTWAGSRSAVDCGKVIIQDRVSVFALQSSNRGLRA